MAPSGPAREPARGSRLLDLELGDVLIGRLFHVGLELQRLHAGLGSPEQDHLDGVLARVDELIRMVRDAVFAEVLPAVEDPPAGRPAAPATEPARHA